MLTIESIDMYDKAVTDTGVVCDCLKLLDILICTAMCCEMDKSPNPIYNNSRYTECEV